MKTGFLFLLMVLLAATAAFSQTLSGKVTDEKNESLPYASVYIKGTTRGTTANSEGNYFMELTTGTYTIVCAYVGYTKQENTITISGNDQVLNFTLLPQHTELKDVEIKANAEDPAYAIIRKAIASRKDHLEEVKEWQATVYMKGIIRTYQVPKKIFGIKIEPNQDIVDSTGKGILYLSESLTRYSKRRPNDYKEELISAKVSGSSQGFGFNSPQDVEFNLYENNINLEGLNSRGFISPIADNALYFYRYKYLGTFYEDGLEINKIELRQKRKFEPCFNIGYINIIENSWRVHSADLWLTKESQMELVDSLRIVQQLFRVNNKYWMPQQTMMDGKLNIFGLQAGANFVAVYSDYVIGNLPAGTFKGNIVKTIDTAANKKSLDYWDSIRPAPLTNEEALDYLKKDTLERRFRDPAYLDSLDRRSNRFGVMKVLFGGTTRINRNKRLITTFPPLIKNLQYNTVEGWLLDFSPTIRRWGDTGNFVLHPQIRYGFENKHLNVAASFSRSIGKGYGKRWRISGAGGKYVFQINPSSPIDPLVNTIGTLLYKRNYMKLYEKAYGRVVAQHRLKNGLQLNFSAAYEDRFPLTNSDTSYSWVKYNNRSFSSNYPEELPAGHFVRHQALLTSVRLTWQPGQKFVQYPGWLESLGSEQPVFSASFTKAWKGIAGSDANFSKWALGVKDDLNMKLAGTFSYQATVGGFINNKNVQLPDWQHFNGNLTIIAGEYLNSFQLAPYYANSTKNRFYSTGNIEWHLNGLFTNKIPVIRRWNWGLVAGSNAFYTSRDKNYFEFFFGVENILKGIRVDFVWGYDGFYNKPKQGVVIGFSGVFAQAAD